MSDTPRTDAKAQFFGFNPDEGEEFVQADFARELERENAELRERLEILAGTNKKQTEKYICVDREHGLWKLAAIDAARKEIQS